MFRFNFSQAKAIADLFINLASAWIIAAMATPMFTTEVLGLASVLNFFRGIVFGLTSLIIALFFLKETNE